MDDKTKQPHAGDRRQRDRRSAAAGRYTGPDRRLADRRADTDRRRSPRLAPVPPAARD